MNLERGTFRVHGDTIEVFPAAFDNSIIRIEMFGDEIDRPAEVDVLDRQSLPSASTSPFIRQPMVADQGLMERALGTIRQELDERLKKR